MVMSFLQSDNKPTKPGGIIIYSWGAVDTETMPETSHYLMNVLLEVTLLFAQQ